ncbi:MAG: hypothetical protein H7Y38_14525 [Armatimonadetes bacterium]|nr:hypothetical protein [Armatimonadota bacterium]
MPTDNIKPGRPTGCYAPRPIRRTNEPGTCLWCGTKLAKRRYTDDLGQRGDNAFCNLSCGYLFGVHMAIAGERFVACDETKKKAN